jgi:hypothetical protein
MRTARRKHLPCQLSSATSSFISPSISCKHYLISIAISSLFLTSYELIHKKNYYYYYLVWENALLPSVVPTCTLPEDKSRYVTSSMSCWCCRWWQKASESGPVQEIMYVSMGKGSC